MVQETESEVEAKANQVKWVAVQKQAQRSQKLAELAMHEADQVKQESEVKDAGIARLLRKVVQRTVKRRT